MSGTNTDIAKAETPFYERSLDSFADEIITRTVKSSVGERWYAVLDTSGCVFEWAFPDFSRSAKNEPDAIALCAQWIRANAKGIGKFAPDSCLKEDSYDFRFQLCRWWQEKEQGIPSSQLERRKIYAGC